MNLNTKITKMLSISKKTLLLIGVTTILLFNPPISKASEYIKTSNEISLISESDIVDKGSRTSNFGQNDIMPVLKQEKHKIKEVVSKSFNKNNSKFDYTLKIENENENIYFSSNKDYKNGDFIEKSLKISTLYYNTGGFFKYAKEINGQKMNPVLKSIEIKDTTNNSIVGYINTININGENVSVHTESKTALIGTQYVYEDSSTKLILNNEETKSLSMN